MTATLSHTDLQRLTLPELYAGQQGLRRLLTDLPTQSRDRDAIAVSLESIDREIALRVRTRAQPLPRP
ncbi:MAG: hypothetical protein AAFR84_23185 [Pseudomonadota bacterium]